MILARTDVVAVTPEELRRRFRADVRLGLLQHPRRIPSKYLYDRRGSELFRTICGLEEYYLARTELEILRRHAADIAEFLGPGCLLIEPGGTTVAKAAAVLAAMESPAGYIAIDISCESLDEGAQELGREVPGVDVRTVCADFTEVASLGTLADRGQRRAVFFPGSTIGNYDPPEAADLLSRFGGWTGPDGRLLLGVDLYKDEDVIAAAYNDAAGVVAEFNLNLLHRIRRELASDIDPSKFRHEAVFDRARARVEMRLVAREDHTAKVGDLSVTFHAGEFIHTLSSYKPRLVDLGDMPSACGWSTERVWTDGRAWFAVLGLSRAAAPRAGRARGPRRRM